MRRGWKGTLLISMNMLDPSSKVLFPLFEEEDWVFDPLLIVGKCLLLVNIRLRVVCSCICCIPRVTCQALFRLKLGCWLRQAGFFYNFWHPFCYSNLLQILLVP